MTPATRQLAFLRAALERLEPEVQLLVLRDLRAHAEPVDPVGRVLLLLLLLLRRDDRGAARPISLAELDAALGVDPRQRHTYLQAVRRAGWSVQTTTLPSPPAEPKRGRPGAADRTFVHALLPRPPVTL